MVSKTSTVGIIGIGIMGSAIASALRPHHQIVVCDFNEEALAQQRAAGSAVAASPAQLAETADVVLMSLPGPDQVRTVVGGVDGLVSGAWSRSTGPGNVVVDLSTVDPQTSREMAALLSEQGVGYLDAPVLGRPHRCGSWTLPVGGSESDLALAEPVLGLIASRVIRVGESGSANILKLLNNLMFGAINAITAETMGAAARLGLDLDVYYTTLADSGAASVSNLFREIAPKIAAEDWSPAFTVDLLAKDNRLALEMIKESGLSPQVAQAVVDLNAAGQAAGLGSLDTSALTKLAQEPEMP